jgi:hypothetical protein
MERQMADNFAVVEIDLDWTTSLRQDRRPGARAVTHDDAGLNKSNQYDERDGTRLAHAKVVSHDARRDYVLVFQGVFAAAFRFSERAEGLPLIGYTSRGLVGAVLAEKDFFSTNLYEIVSALHS